MKEFFMKEFFAWLLGLLGFACLIGVAFITADLAHSRISDTAKRNYERGYLAACKDFHQGNIKYELVEHADGTRTWEKVEKEGNLK